MEEKLVSLLHESKDVDFEYIQGKKGITMISTSDHSAYRQMRDKAIASDFTFIGRLKYHKLPFWDGVAVGAITMYLLNLFIYSSLFHTSSYSKTLRTALTWRMSKKVTRA